MSIEDPDKIHRHDFSAREITFSKGIWRVGRSRTTSGAAYIVVKRTGQESLSFRIDGSSYVQQAKALAELLQAVAAEPCDVPEVEDE